MSSCPIAQGWSTKGLHTIAELIDAMIQQYDAERNISEIETAIKSAIVTSVDPILGLDLHKTINVTACEIGHATKPAINLPSEMTFNRGRISQSTCSMKRSYSNALRDLGPMHPFVKDPFDLLLKNIRSHITYHSALITKANLTAAEHRTTMIDKIQTTFQKFVDDAKASGLTLNSIPRRQSASDFTLAQQSQQTQRTPSSNGQKCAISQDGGPSSSGNLAIAENIKPTRKRTRFEEGDGESSNERASPLTTPRDLSALFDEQLSGIMTFEELRLVVNNANAPNDNGVNADQQQQ